MMKHKFSVGDRVGLNMHVEGATEWDDGDLVDGLRWEKYEDPALGTITNIMADGRAEVEWDEGSGMNDISVLDYLDGDMVNINQLLPETDVEKEMSRLEEEFNRVQKQVRAKCKEASKILKEANKLAMTTGRNLYDMNDYGTLYSTMDECGWRTSSFGC